jgi:hypothetical protein
MSQYPAYEKAIIARHKIGYTPRVEPPEDVERREFHQPCFYCEANGPCRHRRHG